VDIKNKKILMTLMRLEIGGAETHVLELSLELARQGYQVVVASGGGVYEKHLEEADIKHYRVPMYTKSPGKVIKSLWALRQIIQKEKIDIVHAHGRIPAFLCGLLHPFMSFTFVTTAHWVFRTTHGFKYLSNWGEKVMSVSEDIKTYLIENYGTDSKDIYLTINGIDTEKFSPNVDYSSLLQEFSLKKESKKIVYISRMDEDRALVAFHLVEIAPKINEAFPHTDIVIVGSGNVFDKLQALTDKINDQIGRPMITLAGGRTDIDRFAAMADLFIGVSRSALEAMACAKPVIVAGNEGYLGIFDESKLQVGIDTNFCCRGLEASTSQQLFADVQKVLSADEAQTEKWGTYSRQIICQYYSVSKMMADNVAMYCDAVNHKSWDAVISGYYGYKNSGDEALLSAMLTHLRAENPDMKLCVLSKNPAETIQTHGVYSINRFCYGRIRKVIKDAKLFISGGGSLLQDVTSSRSLRYYLFLINMAKKAHTPVMLYANGIGPIQKEKNRLAVKNALENVETITLRETASLEELTNLGVACEHIIVTADPALTLPVADDAAVQQVLQQLGIDKYAKILGIAIRPWKNSRPDFDRVMAEGIDLLCKIYGFTPVFIPMKYPEDYDLSCKIEAQMTCGGYILSESLPASVMIGLVGSMEIVLAERLHSLIYAANGLVPTVGLSYDTKVDAFMEYIGMGTAISVDTLECQKLVETVDMVYKDYSAIKQRLMDKKTELMRLAEENAHIAYKLMEQANG